MGWPCCEAGVLALSLQADFHQQQDQTGISGTGWVHLPLLLAGTVLFPVLAAEGTNNATAYRTLLGYNGLRNLIILIGTNWENNSFFQQE